MTAITNHADTNADRQHEADVSAHVLLHEEFMRDAAASRSREADSWAHNHHLLRAREADSGRSTRRPSKLQVAVAAPMVALLALALATGLIG